MEIIGGDAVSTIADPGFGEGGTRKNFLDFANVAKPGLVR